MRVVVISRVKNEEDIVEAFVRHHCATFDETWILDDGSTDRTTQILRSLADEGLPLRVSHEDGFGNVQGVSTTRMMRDAFSGGADWVLPLDADEFLEVVDPEAYAALLASGEAVLELPWDSFAFDPAATGDVNPATRLVEHTPTRRWNYKVMVPAKAGKRPDAVLFEGNHFLYHGDVRVDTERHPCVRLCHYPIRSVAQYASKVVIGAARYAMLPDPNPDWAYHYRDPLRTLLNDPDAFAARARSDSLNYSLAPSEPRDQDAFRGPLTYLGGELRYTSPVDRLTSNLANHVHQFAAALSRSDSRLRAAETRLEAAEARLAATETQGFGALRRLFRGRTASAARLP